MIETETGNKKEKSPDKIIPLTKTKDNEWKMSIFQPLKQKNSKSKIEENDDEKNYKLIEKSVPNLNTANDHISPKRKIKHKIPNRKNNSSNLKQKIYSQKIINTSIK